MCSFVSGLVNLVVCLFELVLVCLFVYKRGCLFGCVFVRLSVLVGPLLVRWGVCVICAFARVDCSFASLFVRVLICLCI